MKSNTHVVFRDVDHSPALAYTINKKLAKLERFSANIIHSRVVLDRSCNRKSKTKLFRASIELGIKGSPILVTQDSDSPHIAIREAFNSAERKLKASNRQSALRSLKG